MAFTTGVANTTFSGGFVPGTYAIDSNGDVIVAGRVDDYNGAGVASLLRFSANGAMDTNFGQYMGSAYRGLLRLENQPTPDRVSLGGFPVESDVQVLRQPDDKLVVLTSSYMDTYPGMTLQRLLPDGSPDPSLLGARVQLSLPGGVSPTGLALQADGKLLALGCGSIENGGGGDAFVWRFNADGTPDLAFGQDGRLQARFDNLGTWAPDLGTQILPQPDGSMVLFGMHLGPSWPEPVLLRVSADGVPDAAGATALVLPGELTRAQHGGGWQPAVLKEVQQQADGKWLLAANIGELNGGEGMLLRYFADGTPDMGFGQGGHVSLPAGQHAKDVVQLADGRYAVGVEGGDAFGVAILDQQGMLLQSQSVTVGANATLDQLLVQADGKLLLAGQTTQGGPLGEPALPQLALVRLLPDLSLDTGYFNAVESSWDYYLQYREQNLRLTGWNNASGYGNELDNILLGNDASNQLFGREGNDMLDGGRGSDFMDGGAGDDVYYVDNAWDSVTDSGLDGHDVVHSQADLFQLGSGVEDLVLEGYARDGIGNALANRLSGNDQFNKLSGGEGDDIIDGGKGADMMVGEAGSDTYYVDDAGDQVVEYPTMNPADIDTVISSADFALGAEVENLVLTREYTTGNGNKLANLMTSKANYTTLAGGEGNDSYVIADDYVQVIEHGGTAGGIDKVVSSAMHTRLADNVEILELAGNAIVATGNAQDNTIAGNALDNYMTGEEGNDVLDGGAGKDTMAGGTGADTYFVDNAGDKVEEVAEMGVIDTVNSTISYTLTANVERLALQGNGAINGSGNELNNSITGNSYANVLNGGAGIDVLEGGAGNDVLLGGSGADKLSGGTGADRFVWSSVGDSPAANFDAVIDFRASEGDKIDLSGIDANPYLSGDQAFRWVSSFSGNATGQVCYVNGKLLVSTNADPAAELVVSLTGVMSLAPASIVL